MQHVFLYGLFPAGWAVQVASNSVQRCQLGKFVARSGDLNCQKQNATNLVTCFWRSGECWRWHQYILATKWKHVPSSCPNWAAEAAASLPQSQNTLTSTCRLQCSRRNATLGGDMNRACASRPQNTQSFDSILMIFFTIHFYRVWVRSCFEKWDISTLKLKASVQFLLCVLSSLIKFSIVSIKLSNKIKPGSTGGEKFICRSKNNHDQAFIFVPFQQH